MRVSAGEGTRVSAGEGTRVSAGEGMRVSAGEAMRVSAGRANDGGLALIEFGARAATLAILERRRRVFALGGGGVSSLECGGFASLDIRLDLELAANLAPRSLRADNLTLMTQSESCRARSISSSI